MNERGTRTVYGGCRFARDHFALEYHVRRLRKAGVRLVSITQDLGDDPMSVMVRQVCETPGPT